MDADRILDPLKSTLLSSLIGAERLAFIGDRATIEYLRAFFTHAPAASDHIYLSLDDSIEDVRGRLVDRRIVASSVTDENAVVERVAQRVSSVDAPQILRLFADLFVNLSCGDDPVHAAPADDTWPDVAYAIVGTPRCGSEYLCSVLAGTGSAGFPEEHLRTESQVLTQHCRFDCGRYLRALMARRITPNRVFGTKIISHFFFEHVRRSPPLKRDLERFRYIHIVRRDRIGQAISGMIAARTGVWHLRDAEAQAKYQDVLDTLEIRDADLRFIRQLAFGFERQDRDLARFLTRRNIPALTVTYEDLVSDPAAHLTSIVRFLNLDIPVPDVAVGLKTTRSPFSEMVRDRYLKSRHARKGVLGLLPTLTF